jgi:hypothetical protein
MFSSGGSESAGWLAAFVNAAKAAGDDPALCVELALQLRTVGDALGVTKSREQLEQDALAFGRETRVGSDRCFHCDTRIDADRYPTEAA